MKREAIVIDCASGEELQHAMLDYCTTCAPFWRFFPICPVDRSKLRETGYCKKCRKFYKVTEGLNRTNPNIENLVSKA